jgi:hypothetical protein
MQKHHKTKAMTGKVRDGEWVDGEYGWQHTQSIQFFIPTFNYVYTKK